jgi:hypothetical protein
VLRAAGVLGGVGGATGFLVWTWPMPQAFPQLWLTAAVLAGLPAAGAWAVTHGTLRRCRRLLRQAAAGRRKHTRSLRLQSDFAVRLVDRTLTIRPVHDARGDCLQVSVQRDGVPGGRTTAIVGGPAGEHPLGDPDFDASVRLVRPPARLVVCLDAATRPWLAAYVRNGGRVDGDTLVRTLPPDASDDQVLATVADLERLSGGLVPGSETVPRRLLTWSQERDELPAVRRTAARLLLRDHGATLEARLLVARLRSTDDAGLAGEARRWTAHFGDGLPDQGGLSVVDAGGELALLDDAGLSLPDSGGAPGSDVP